MDLPASLFAPGPLLACNALAGFALALAAWRVDWKRLPGEALNAWMGACVLVMALWLMKGGLKPGLSFHLLGATVFTLLMGPWLALLALALVLAALAAGGHGDWPSLGFNWLLAGAMPVGVSAAVLAFCRRHLPAQLFVYVFVNAFLTGGLSLFLCGAGGVAALGLAGAYPADYLLDEALPFYFLLSWSEAFISGLVMAILIVYRPQWVATFDDVRYLGREPDDND